MTPIGSGFGHMEEIPLAKGTRCFSINGFSLNANTATRAMQRDRLRQLIEYIARGPLSNRRLEITPERRIRLELKTRYSDGTTHLIFTFGEFLEKLVALIPPPRGHLVRWGGVLAPNSSFRREITRRPDIKKGFQFREENGEKFYRSYTWSKMLARVFKIDVETCECGGRLMKVCAVNERESIRRHLKREGLDRKRHISPP